MSFYDCQAWIDALIEMRPLYRSRLSNPIFFANFLRQMGQYQKGRRQFQQMSMKPLMRHSQYTQCVTPNMCPISCIITRREGYRINFQFIYSFFPYANSQSHLRKEKMPTRATYFAQPQTQFQFLPAYMSFKVTPSTQYASFGTRFSIKDKKSWAKHWVPQQASRLTTFPFYFQNQRIGCDLVVMLVSSSLMLIGGNDFTVKVRQKASQNLLSWSMKSLSNQSNG